jgi:hypothetical protein
MPTTLPLTVAQVANAAPLQSPVFYGPVTFAALTQNRIPFSGVNGVQQDSANLTYVVGVGLTLSDTLLISGGINSSNSNPLQCINASYLYWKDSGGTSRRIFGMNSGNVVYIGVIDPGWGAGVNVQSGGAVNVSVNGASAAFISCTFNAGGSTTFFGKLNTVASATGAASLNVPNGVAPTSPVQGDVWADANGTISFKANLAPTGYISSAVGGAVASASTITPTGPVFHITGAVAIATINLPWTGFTGTLTLIPDGNFTTTTGGNIAKAITANIGQAIAATYDGTKWQLSFLSGATAFVNAAAPTATASTTSVMMGMNLTVTPTRSGTLVISGSGQMANGTINDGATVQLYYGTGAAPTNGAAVSGTALGSPQTHTSLVAADTAGWSFTIPLSNATIGTTYWIDVALKAVTGGSASVTGVNLAVVEL